MSFDLRKLLTDRTAALLVGCVAFATYMATLLPGVHHFGDTTKAQFLGKFLGITHPTGYPLYVALTAPLSHIPIGTLAFRINAFSAVCGAGAAVFLFLLLRDRGVRQSFALLSSFAFCFSRTAWDQAVIAEVYALNVLFVGAVLYSLSRFANTKSARWFLTACGLYSASFGNHLTMITLLPAFALAVWLIDRTVLRNGRLMGTMLLLILVGASQYYYLFSRTQSDSLYLEYKVANLDEFFDFISGERYRRSMFAFDWDQVFLDRLPRFTGQLMRDLGPFCLLFPLSIRPAALRDGVARLEPMTAVLLLATAGQFIWVIGYDIPDIEVYLIPTAWCLAALSGLGLEGWAKSWGEWTNSLSPLLGAVFLVPLILFHQPDHRQSERFAAQTQKQLQLMGRDAALINILHYSPRMAYVYFLYGEELTKSHNLHLSYSTTPKKAAAYLRGKPVLLDSHTKERLPLGLSLYVDSRGAKAERWKEFGLKLSRARAGLYRVELDI